ncbi:MAG: YdcF family protein [Firmicutes bacterium]|nr:YdcF family protein [Bacillota bacterium]
MAKKTVDAMIVLGAQVRPEGIPSEALRRRLCLALQRYRERPVPIICCGAQGPREPAAEGDFMCAWLRKNGVPDTMLLSENRSTDTMENIRYAKAMMEAAGLSHALVVTSDYHVRRALAICRYYGVCAEGAGSPSVPRYWLKNNVRELLAWAKFFLLRA